MISRPADLNQAKATKTSERVEASRVARIDLEPAHENGNFRELTPSDSSLNIIESTVGANRVECSHHNEDSRLAKSSTLCGL